MSNAIETIKKRDTDYFMSAGITPFYPSIATAASIFVATYFSGNEIRTSDTIGIVSISLLICYIIPSLHAIRTTLYVQQIDCLKKCETTSKGQARAAVGD